MPLPCSKTSHGSHHPPKPDAQGLTSANPSSPTSQRPWHTLDFLLTPCIPRMHFPFTLPSLPGKLLILHSPVHLSPLLKYSLEAPFPTYTVIVQPPLWKCSLPICSSWFHSNELGSNYNYCVPGPWGHGLSSHHSPLGADEETGLDCWHDLPKVT